MTTSSNSPILTAVGIAAVLGSFAPAAVFLFLGQPAAAQAAPQPRAAAVRIDVSAKTPDALRQEVISAARRVCNEVIVHSPLEPRELTRCRKDAEARGMDQIAPAPSLLASRD